MDKFLYFFNIIVFILFSALVLGSLVRQRGYASDAQQAVPEHEKLWLLLIIAAALLLRLWDFGAVPCGINQDGAMAAVDGKALADYGTDRFGTRLPAHLYAWGFGQMSSLLSYLIALFVKLFGLNTVTARLPQLLASLMGGLCFYLFVRDGFGKRAGLTAALLLAVNPWHMLQSRWALDCNLLPHFFMAGIYFLHRGLCGRRTSLYISMIFFGLCMYCYGIAIYTVSLFLMLLGLFLLWKKQLSLRELLLCAAVWLLVCWPFILTMAINYFKWDTISLPFVTMQYFSGSVRASDILFFSPDFPAQLKINLSHLVNVVILQKKDLPWNDIAGFGTVYKFAMPLALGGLFLLAKSRSTAAALALAGLFTGLWAGLVTNNVNINRVNIIFYFVLLLTVLGAELIARTLPGLSRSLPVVFAAAGIMLGTVYFTDYADSLGRYFYRGFGEALAAAESSGAERIYVTADAQAEGYAHVSEILTLFYDKTDAEYFQGKTNMNGAREQLPYSQRFVYMSMDESSAAFAATDSAFVIKTSDSAYFPTDSFELYFFDGYVCALPET